MIKKDYLLTQLQGLYCIIEGDIKNAEYDEEYLREKFDSILSGKGISFHAYIEEALKTTRLGLIDND